MHLAVGRVGTLHDIQIGVWNFLARNGRISTCMILCVQCGDVNCASVLRKRTVRCFGAEASKAWFVRAEQRATRGDVQLGLCYEHVTGCLVL